VPAGAFWPAEDYHQDFYVKNPVRYKFYRTGCGRDARLKQLWGAHRIDSSRRYASVEIVNDPRLEVTPESANQPPPLVGYNAWSGDLILVEAVKREGGGWISERASRMGDLVGSERMQTLAMQANRYAPS